MIVKVDVIGLQQGMGEVKHGFHVHSTGIKNMTDDVAGSNYKKKIYVLFKKLSD